MTPVTAVIPNWNGRQYLSGLFSDIRDQSIAFHRLIVVDGASSDGSGEWAETNGAQVIRLTSNAGFAVAVNVGVEAAGTEFVAVLNNDLRLDPDWLAHISAGIRDKSFAVGKILSYYSPEQIDGTFDALCRGATAWRCGSGRVDSSYWSLPRPVTFPPFTAVLLRKSQFLELGGLDAAFESYLEDVEYGLRCASKGYTGWYVPDAICRHYGSGTLGRWSSNTVRHIARNQLILIARHYPPELVREYGWRIAVAQVLWGLVALRHGRGAAWVRGKLEGLRAYRYVRRAGSINLRTVLEESENEIRRLQADTGFDLYWRLYFALTS